MDTHLDTDVAVIGGGLGGVAAALAAARRGHRVVLTEETGWVGGQLTSQGVPPDEHPWIEQFGCTASYRRLREEIRGYYRRWYPLSEQARRSRHLNPGLGAVSGLCVEPRVGLAVLEAMLAPHVSSGRLRLLLRHRPTAAATDGDRVTGVTLGAPDGEPVHVAGRYVLDATETGQLLELAGVEHRTGAESRAETAEPSAPEAPRPLAMQAVSWCFALEHRAGEDHTIPRPAGYEHWREHCPPGWTGGPLLSFTAPVPRTGEPLTRTLAPNPDEDAGGVADHRTVGGDFELWAFRRIAARASFAPGHLESDVTLVNWPMIDYLAGPVYGQGPQAAARHLAGARELSLSFLHWLQTEAPRPDGGTGWPGLRLRPDVMGTRDGLAMAPYIRESRRIVAMETVREQDVALAHRPDGLGRAYPDSVGVGSYRIDLHPTTGGDPYLDVASCPFQLPLRALLPVRVDNLLPAAKNIGTTHVTNGCYRLHPVEWNVGEVAGELAAHCLERGLTPHAVADRPERVKAFQQELVAAGVELTWPQVRGY